MNKIKFPNITLSIGKSLPIFVVMTIGERLKAFRKAKDWSIEKASWETKISAKTIYNHESGESEPRYSDLLTYAKAYGIPAINFLSDESIDALENVSEQFQARGKEGSELISPDDMKLLEYELSIIRKIRLAREAERKKKFGDNPARTEGEKDAFGL